MTKRVFLIHGWGGQPDSGWKPWLKKELENKGFEVHVPAMPNTDEPKMDVWIPFLKDAIGEPDENTYIIGHSMGCQTILRYLEGLPENSKIGGVILVAGFVNLKNLENDDEENIARPWLETPINFEKIKKRTQNIVAIFSDNDQFVPLTDSDIFREKLGTKIIVQHEKGHFSGEDGFTELPVVLDELLGMV